MFKIITSFLLIPLVVVSLAFTPAPVQANTDAELADLEAQVLFLLQLLQQLRANQTTNVVYYQPQSNGSSDVDVRTRVPQDIDDDAVTLRGEVDFNAEDEATVWFQYGRSQSSLRDETVRIVLDEDDDDEQFSARVGDLRDDTRYYYRAVAEDESGDRDYGSIMSFVSDDHRSSRNDDDEPEVDTNRVDNIDENSAELNGEVDMNDFDNGLVFFIWGEDEDLVEDVEDDYDEYNDVDEEGDDLQKERVDSSLDDDAEYYLDIVNLDEDTDIYFAICVEYEDEDDDETIVCSSVDDFTTGEDDDDNRRGDDEPEATTKSATDIGDSSANLRGEIDMNDFTNGLVFFAWGEDEDQVADLEDDHDEFNDIDEDGDDLQVRVLDFDLDEDDDYDAYVSGLDEDTDIYFVICVEYEGEDDDLTIECGRVEDFETDER